MFRYRAGDIYSLLWAAYYEVRADPKAPTMVFGTSSGTPSARLDRQLNDFAASQVVNLIDRKLPSYASSYFRFVYGQSDWEDYCKLSRWLVRRIEHRSKEFREFEEPGFGVDLGRLVALVPYQYKYRLTKNKSMYMGQEKVAELLMVTRSVYRRKYLSHWEYLLDEMSGIVTEYGTFIIDFAECGHDEFEKSA